ncbi:MAG: AAA family ATPase [Lachnospiraceae bacterium]|jgi:energy-coupling factor transporter ATP-binding protein EcfA2|nr:AAA family ATPase [Lachnospiraceae bacterium]
MKLTINRIGKVKHAEIVLDGITVIAGKNDTGKSTIGKTLFALFGALSNMDERISKERKQGVVAACRKILYEFENSGKVGISWLQKTESASSNLAKLVIDELNESGEVKETRLTQSIERVVSGCFKDDIVGETLADVCARIAASIMNVVKVPSEQIALGVLSGYFASVFYAQVCTQDNRTDDTTVLVQIKDKAMEVVFRDDTCVACQTSIQLTNHAWFIGDPLLIDRMKTPRESNPMDTDLKAALTTSYGEDPYGGVIEGVLAREKLDEITDVLHNVVAGNVIEESEMGFFLTISGAERPIEFNNLSTGLKAFVILKMLIERRKLKDRDVLILDEPEIHLHPEWEEVYAHLVVLLQKAFGLTILITTHSIGFLEWLEYYSQKLGIADKCRYYLAQGVGMDVVFKDVSQSTEEIYAQMVRPGVKLDRLRYEMEKDNDDEF